MRSILQTRESCYTDSVANLTITVDAEILKRARIRALERGESVNRFLAEQLNVYVQDEDLVARRREAARKLAALSDQLARRPLHDGSWTREELWERHE